MACLSSLSMDHPLLEQRSPAYTHATVRRAFIVWLRCGQRNNFRDVCDYYHRLEAMENKLPEETRALSRHHEFSLFVSDPPTSPYQQEMFPQLYSSTQLDTHHYAQTIQNVYQKAVDISNAKIDEKPVTHQDIFDASQVFKTTESRDVKDIVYDFKLEEIKAKAKECKESRDILNQQQENIGTTKQEIIETSQMIKNYCKQQQIPLRNFLESFKEYAARCELNNTVNNVGFYIKRKMVYDELKLAVKVFRAKSDFAVNEKKLERQEALKVFVTDKCVNATEENQKILLNNLTKTEQKFTDDVKCDAATNNTTHATAKPDERLTKNNLVMIDNLDKNQTGLNEKVIKLLRRDNTDVKINNVNFSSAHFDKIDIQKCRKI